MKYTVNVTSITYQFSQLRLKFINFKSYIEMTIQTLHTYLEPALLEFRSSRNKSVGKYKQYMNRVNKPNHGK